MTCTELIHRAVSSPQFLWMTPLPPRANTGLLISPDNSWL